MKVGYSARSAGEIVRILDRLRSHNPQAAGRVAVAIEHKVRQLADQPRSGHKTDFSTVLETVLSRYPYRILYTIDPGRIRILSVRHTARRWPVKIVDW